MKIHVNKTIKWRVLIFLTLAISIFVVCQREYRRAYIKSSELHKAATQYPYLVKCIENYKWVKKRDNSENIFILDKHWIRRHRLKIYVTLRYLIYQKALGSYKTQESLDILKRKDLVELINEARKISEEE